MNPNQPNPFLYENVWQEARSYQDAERLYVEASIRNQRRAANPSKLTPKSNDGNSKPSLVSEIAYARQQIQKSLTVDLERNERPISSLFERIKKVEEVQDKLQKAFSDMAATVQGLNTKINLCCGWYTEELAKSQMNCNSSSVGKVVNGAEGMDELDSFASDEETEEEMKLHAERLRAYEIMHPKKPAVVAKSSIILDVKPWSDETNLQEMEGVVRSIDCDGLKWGGSSFVPLAYGIKKLRIIATVEDEKVSVDWLQEAIQDNEDLVQSVDVVAFNKL